MQISKTKKIIFCTNFLTKLLYVKLFIALKGFSSFLKMLEKSKKASSNKHQTVDTKSLNTLVRLAKKISSAFKINSCLTVASTIFLTLKKLNIKSDFFIGVKFNSENKFESHAWISLDNFIFDENENSINSFKIIKKFSS